MAHCNGIVMKEYLYFITLLTAVTLSYGKPQLIEGDIVLDSKLQTIRSRGYSNHAENSRQRRNLFGVKKKTHEHRWKDGFVPYTISTELGEPARNAIEKAFIEIEKYTCIQFSPWKQEEHFIEFIKDEGCYSSVGRQNGRQVLSIGEGCEFRKTVVHELLHSLGMFHEQTRLDRDLYVSVLWWNMQKGAEKNFDTYDHGIINSLSYPYDYRSATHYLNKDFTKNGKDTIQAIDKPGKLLGNTRGMSKIDVKKIYKSYRCYKNKKRPKKEKCHDVMDWCHFYTRHCNTKWFAEKYCMKSCKACIER